MIDDYSNPDVAAFVEHLRREGHYVSSAWMVKRHAAAKTLGVSVKTLANWASEGKGPTPAKTSHGNPWYPVKGLLDWINARTVQGALPEHH